MQENASLTGSTRFASDMDHFCKMAWDVLKSLAKQARERHGMDGKAALLQSQSVLNQVMVLSFLADRGLIQIDGKSMSSQRLSTRIMAGNGDVHGTINRILRAAIPAGVLGESIVDVAGPAWERLFSLVASYAWCIDEHAMSRPTLQDYDAPRHVLTPAVLGYMHERITLPISMQDRVDLETLGSLPSLDRVLPGNHDAGAYYTPPRVTRYICDNVILPHLFGAGIISREQARDRLESWKATPEKIDVIEGKLDGFTIVDPAAGTGAFLIEAIGLLVELRQFIATARGTPFDKYHATRKAIERNIHGVDVMGGAVDVCRLRLWLSLVSCSIHGATQDMATIKYNLRTGNSLAGWVRADAGPASLVPGMIESDATVTFLDHLRARKVRIDGVMLDGMNPFHWYREFPDAMNAGGFDIVVSNPPYINSKATTALEKAVYSAIYGMSDDFYNYFFRRSFDLLKPGGMLGCITSNTYFTLSTKRSLRELLQGRRLVEICVPNPRFFSTVGVITAIVIARNELHPTDYELRFVDASRDFSDPVLHPVNISLYRNAIDHVFFLPSEINMRLHERFNERVQQLVATWWDKIRASTSIDAHKVELEAYRNALQPGDITLLGLITDGGVGLQTGDNGRMVGVVRGHPLADAIIKSRPAKLWRFVASINGNSLARKDPLAAITSIEEARAFLSRLAERDIRVLFDRLKQDHGQGIFGRGYLYKIIEPHEIMAVDGLSEQELSRVRERGITGKRTWVPYSRGDKDGHQWYAETPYYIDWSEENVAWLKKNSGKKGYGMPVMRGPRFYFKAGFCWNCILNPRASYIKARLKPVSVQDQKSASFFSLSEKTPDWYITCLLNSRVFDVYRKTFLNNTVSVLVNDLRMMPVVIPTVEQITRFKALFDEAVAIKKQQFAKTMDPTRIKARLASIQARVDRAVNALYGLPDNILART